MGISSLQALEPWLKKGKGAFVVWLSSNPDGWELQQHVYLQLLGALESYASSQSLTKSIGLVLGATKLANIDKSVLKRALNFPLLLPGVGAQGASIDDTLRNVMRAGACSLFPISRGLLDVRSLTSNELHGLRKEVGEMVDQRLLSYSRQF
jgi:orotidine-5'-phosphate decarboxylase